MSEVDFSVPQMDSLAQYLRPRLLEFKEKRVCVLEWGSGTSTVYFTKFLKEHGIDFEWVSLEHNRAWFEEVQDVLDDDPRVKLVHIDVGSDAHRPQSTMDEYVSYPRTLGKKFDIVIVDGRKRRRCILEAKTLLAPHGEVLLHDAFRHYYWSAFHVFPDNVFVSKNVWRGRLEQASFSVQIKNAVINTARKTQHVLRYVYRTLRAKLRIF